MSHKYGTEWPRIRAEILKRDNYRCQGFCSTSQLLEIHHIEPWHTTKNNDPSNLITLCESCHIESDGFRALFGERPTEPVLSPLEQRLRRKVKLWDRYVPTTGRGQ